MIGAANIDTVLALPLLSGDVDYVFEHFWERGELEIKIFDISMEKAIEIVKGYIGTRHAYTVMNGYFPVAIFGCYETKPGYWRTWFLATGEFNGRLGIKITRITHAIINDAAKIEKMVQMESISALTHPDAERWFYALGFSKDNGYNVTVCDNPLYRFYMNFNTGA